MANNIIDEKLYPIGWRFNVPDCLVPEHKKNKLRFLNPKISSMLWDSLFNEKHLMLVSSKDYEILEKYSLDFEEQDNFIPILKNLVEENKKILFFWGRSESVITESEIFINYWSDFFYPADETDVAVIDDNKLIITFEEKLFVIKLNKKFILKELLQKATSNLGIIALR